MIVRETHEAYIANPAVSRSMLWSLETMTPYRAKFSPQKSSHAFDIGTAAHVAILEPHRFDAAVMRGPSDRRGNKWKDAEIAAENAGAVLLTESDHDRVRLMRDASASHPILRRMLSGAMIEHSGYAEDRGQAVKVRPDVFNPGLGLIADVKSTVDTSPDSFSRSVAKYGYHVQDYMYRHVWALATGAPVEGFLFICVSKDELPEISCYELDELARDEGQRVYERSMETYRRCADDGVWPSYPATVKTISLPSWAISKGDE